MKSILIAKNISLTQKNYLGCCGLATNRFEYLELLFEWLYVKKSSLGDRDNCKVQGIVISKTLSLDSYLEAL